MTDRPIPEPGREPARAWVRAHLSDVCHDDVLGEVTAGEVTAGEVPAGGEMAGSPAFTGGQTAADEALARVGIAGYAKRRSIVTPVDQRGASKLSPYIRHGLLPLRRVWDHVDGAPGYDRFRYQGELLWQDHARHWYAVYGEATARPIAYEPVRAAAAWDRPPWWRDMACVDATLDELTTDGWVVNQARMWLASQWSVRAGADTFEGEDEMFRHLLDGSRAANRLGWQWCAGTTRPKAHGFARRQVTRRAASLCERCELRDNCPIGGYAKVESRSRVERPAPLDPAQAFGPTDVDAVATRPEVVWLTAESLGDADPALASHPDLPVVFVFDRPLLARLRLSSKRLIFLTETLADLATRRSLRIALGSPSSVLSDYSSLAVTFAPVPGFRRISGRLDSAVELHPWPWLRPPTPALRADLVETGRLANFREWCQLTRAER